MKVSRRIVPASCLVALLGISGAPVVVRAHVPTEGGRAALVLDLAALTSDLRGDALTPQGIPETRFVPRAAPLPHRALVHATQVALSPPSSTLL